MDSKTIGKSIAQLRGDRELSQDVLSGLAGIDRSYLSKIELGLKSPTVKTLYKLADAMEISGSEILRTAEELEKRNTDESV